MLNTTLVVQKTFKFNYVAFTKLDQGEAFRLFDNSWTVKKQFNEDCLHSVAGMYSRPTLIEQRYIVPDESRNKIINHFNNRGLGFVAAPTTMYGAAPDVRDH